MALKPFLPIVAPKNTIDRGMQYAITFTGELEVPPGFIFSPGVPFAAPFETGDWIPPFLGGVVPKNSKGFPPALDNFDNLPVVLGWAGQFQFYQTNLGPVVFPPRPLNGPVVGDPVYETYSCYEPKLYYGKTGTLLIGWPQAVISNSGAVSFRGDPDDPTPANVTIDDPSIAKPLTNQGISLLCIQSGGQGINFYPLLQPFPVSGMMPGQITLDASAYGDTPPPGPPLLGKPYWDFTIDPTCFTGGEILSFSWHGATPPYTIFTVTDTTDGGVPPWATGVINILGGGPPNARLTTIVLSSLIANHISQVASAIGSLVNFRHVFVVDSGCPNLGIYPNPTSALSLLNAPWIKVRMADFSDPSMPASVIADEVALFFQTG